MTRRIQTTYFPEFSDWINKSLIGTEDLFSDLKAFSGGNFPPYNIEMISENEYRITVATAGFSKDQLSIQIDNNVLTVEGNSVNEEKTETEYPRYLYRGIAERKFKRSFRLMNHVEVKNVSLVDGLLNISLKREVPEEKKPKVIQIN